MFMAARRCEQSYLHPRNKVMIMPYIITIIVWNRIYDTKSILAPDNVCNSGKKVRWKLLWANKGKCKFEFYELRSPYVDAVSKKIII